MPNVFVTGASGTIGKGLCLEYAKRGYQVAVHYNRSKAPAEEVLREVEALGAKGYLIQGDISSVPDIERMFNEVEEKIGGLDVMINNAGVTVIFPLLEATEKKFDRVVDTDLKGTYFSTKYAALNMIRHGIKGTIINISSNHDKGCWNNFTAYAAVKAGLDKFTQNAAMELAHHGIRVVAIAPGYTGPDDCNETRKVFGIDDTDYYDGVTSCIPLKRFCTASEIGKLACFLSSEDAGYITGTCITADGGSLLPALSGKWKILNSDPLDPELDEWPGKGPNGEKQK